MWSVFGWKPQNSKYKAGASRYQRNAKPQNNKRTRQEPRAIGEQGHNASLKQTVLSVGVFFIGREGIPKHGSSPVQMRMISFFLNDLFQLIVGNEIFFQLSCYLRQTFDGRI